ncbi:hypothetical protein AUC68_02375 [Methyloceanibacter methanicus]|uniref:Response regulatory domain-containing protein n=1 Tax=Methyloceanibacter methanicus TaxID=1774968 RepID=A0A1E3W2I7_9HYPH|nr:response regulator [Methyloceanibacter methanicus]ODR99973.1 hypothetical protein AUC68_02375 [Methyloceanibacter methanicus]
MDEAVLRGSALQPGHYDSYLESEGVRTLRVLVADDQTLFRAGFRRLLAELLPGAVVTEVSNAAEAWKTLNREEDFDLLLLDLSTPGIQEGPGANASWRNARAPRSSFSLPASIPMTLPDAWISVRAGLSRSR